MVAKKGQANRRPAGVKGKYKVVDGRMKKDQRKKKLVEKKSGARGKAKSGGRGSGPSSGAKARSGGSGGGARRR